MESFSDLIKEKDFLKNNMELIGNHYENSSDMTPFISRTTKQNLKDFTQFLYLEFSQQTSFIFQKDDPYDYINNDFESMKKDSENGYIRVPSGGDDSPILRNHNLIFRAVHDYIHILTDKSFSYEDEVDTYIYTLEFLESWGKRFNIKEDTLIGVAKIIRSEIIYQSAYKNKDGENVIEQKVVY